MSNRLLSTVLVIVSLSMMGCEQRGTVTLSLDPKGPTTESKGTLNGAPFFYKDGILEFKDRKYRIPKGASELKINQSRNNIEVSADGQMLRPLTSDGKTSGSTYQFKLKMGLLAKESFAIRQGVRANAIGQ